MSGMAHTNWGFRRSGGSGGEVEGDNAALFYYKDPESARHLSSNKYYSPMGGRKWARAN